MATDVMTWLLPLSALVIGGCATNQLPPEVLLEFKYERMEFDSSAEVLVKDATDESESAPDEGTLAILVAESMFEMPVRFNVNGIDMLTYGRNDPWARFAILSMADAGQQALEDCLRSGKGIFWVPNGSTIVFIKEGDRILVKVGDIESRATPQRLTQAFEDYGRKVRQLFRREAPQVLELPYWRDWFKKHEDEDKK